MTDIGVSGDYDNSEFEQLEWKKPCNDDIANDNPVNKNNNNDEQIKGRSNLGLPTAALCLCNLIQAYLLISIFPYAGFMAIHLVPGTTSETAGSKAGIIASSFMFGRMLSSFQWGLVADIYGRKTTLIVSLLLSAVFSFLFGISTTYHLALLSRFFLGASNAIIGTVKTTVTEMARGDEHLEAKSTGLVIGMRSWGYLISPALGGFLAEPLKQYPNLFNDPTTTTTYFTFFLSKYPFVLPNILGSLLCILATIGVILYVEETLPKDKIRSIDTIPNEIKTYFITKLSSFCHRNNQPPDHLQNSELQCLTPTVLHKHKNKKFKSDSSSTNGRDDIIRECWSNSKIRYLFLVYWLFSFVVTGIDEIFPLFCLSSAAGLGLSENSIGKILSSSGVLFALLQYTVYTAVIKRYGVYASLSIGVAVGTLCIMLVPLSLLFNNSGTQLSFRVFFFLTLVIGVNKIFSCIFFASITIATNKQVPPEYRATMNGFNMVGASLTKALSPITFGTIIAFLISYKNDDIISISPYIGSTFIFLLIGSFGFYVLLLLHRLSSSTTKINTVNKDLPTIS